MANTSNFLLEWYWKHLLNFIFLFFIFQVPSLFSGRKTENQFYWEGKKCFWYVKYRQTNSETIFAILNHIAFIYLYLLYLLPNFFSFLFLFCFCFVLFLFSFFLFAHCGRGEERVEPWGSFFLQDTEYYCTLKWIHCFCFHFSLRRLLRQTFLNPVIFCHEASLRLLWWKKVFDYECCSWCLYGKNHFRISTVTSCT